MSWDAFSAEAVRLDAKLRRLYKHGRISEALRVIKTALEHAHQHGPSNMSYEDFEKECEANHDD